MSSGTCKQEENGKKYLVFREKPHQHRFLYHVILFFKSEGEIEAFSDEQNLRKFITNRLDLNKILKQILQKEGKL